MASSASREPDIFGLLIHTPLDYVIFFAVFMFIAIEIARRLRRSPYGRSLLAIRDDPVAAASVGKSAPYYRVTTFALAGAIAGAAGVLYGSYLRFISPDQFDINTTIVVLAMVMVGGRGTLLGPIVGAVILVFLPDLIGLLPIDTSQLGPLQQIVYGLALIAVVALRPAGLRRSRPEPLERLRRMFRRKPIASDVREGVS